MPNYWDTIQPEDVDAMRAKLKALRAAQARVKVEQRVRNADMNKLKTISDAAQ